MSHDAPKPASPHAENLVDLLLAFFPGKGEMAAFVGGIVAGAAILGLLTLIAFGIGGHKGIWPTF